MKGFFAKKSQEPKKILKEFRAISTENYKPGTEINLEVLKDKKYVDVRAKTIGKGFAGSMKRHNFSGMRATHTVFQSLIEHMVQQDNVKIQVRYLKEKKWLVTWVQNTEQP